MKRTWLIMALLASFGTAMAQDEDTTKVQRQINIEKEYTPEIKDVKRKDIEYREEETTVRPSNLTYSNYALPINPTTPFSPLEAEKQGAVRMKAAKSGYADLGLGFNMNWRAEGFYRALNSEENRLDLHLNHIGTYWGKTDPKAYIRTALLCDYSHFFDGQQLDANVAYRNQYYSYYGEDFLNWDTLPSLGMEQFQCRHTFRMNAGAHSTESMSDWDYKSDIGYRMDNLQFDKVTEHYVFGGLTGYKAYGKHQIELKFRVDGYLYKSEGNAFDHSSNAFVEVSPYYNLNMSFMDLRVGARMIMTCMRGEVFNAMPDVTATFHPHRMLRLTLAAVGDYRCNSLSTMMDMNPYYIFTDLDTLKNTYTPADFRFGISVTPVSDLSLSARVQYAIIKDEVNYFNRWGLRAYPEMRVEQYRYFGAMYTDTKHLQVGANARYVFKERYSLMADFAWNRWFVDEGDVMMYKPECELHVGVELMPVDGLRFDINYYLATGRRCSDVTALRVTDDNGQPYEQTMRERTIKMADIHDLNIGASYLIKKLVTVYVRANNILGSIDNIKWQRWNGYDNIGFNMTFGAKIAF